MPIIGGAGPFVLCGVGEGEGVERWYHDDHFSPAAGWVISADDNTLTCIEEGGNQEGPKRGLAASRASLGGAEVRGAWSPKTF